MNENRELYVDLQLDDWIEPDDDFPVGVTTWKILQEDWWQQSWIILNWKTTSWDYVRLIYANDGKLYYDPWTWEWIQIATWWDLPWVATSTELWLIKLGSDVEQTESIETPTATAGRTYAVQLNADNQAVVNVPWENAEYESLPEEQWGTDESLVTTWEKYIWNHKQDALTAGTRITIQNNVISADVSGVMTYMWNVTDSSQLPASWNQWDCWYDETAKTLWAWDGTQWNDIGGTGIDLTNYFNMTVNTSDDITEGTTNLFVTNVEKNTWNNKQDTLVAWNNITINWNVISATDTDTTYTAWDWINIDVNNVISNTAKFDPDNAGTMWQFLKKTNNGYQWADVPWWSWTSYTAWDWIDITNNVISNTDRFNPTNQATIWYVLKASGVDTYYRAPESWWGWWGSYTAWDWISISNHVITNTKPFEPDNWATWEVGQVITKTADGYEWSDIELPSGENNVKFWTLDSSTQDNPTQQEIYEWLEADVNNWAIINDTHTNDVFVFYKFDSSDTAIFYGTKRISRVSDAWNYTSQYQQELKLFDSTISYNILVHENDDDATHTNYLSAIGAQYDSQNPFIPTEQYQPATKEYVDRAATWSITWVVTMDTTGTTYSAPKVWVGTQAQYNAITPVNWVIYNIISSS